MTRSSPRALLAFAAIGVALAADSSALIGAVGAPALLAMASSRRGRRDVARRLRLVAPLVGPALLFACLGACLGAAPAREVVRPALRIVTAAAWSSWLSSSVTPRQIDAALRALHVPDALVALLAQARRFGAQLASTLAEAWGAAALRGGTVTARVSVRSAGQVAGVVLVRALDRAERVSVAAALRGAGEGAP